MSKVRVNWGRLPEDRSVKLFEVYNTSHNSLYVLAPDEVTAMSIACSANHVYSPAAKIADNSSRFAYEVRGAMPVKLRAHQDSVRLAIAQRLQGTVHVENGQVTVGHEVIAQ
jgi:hypothetical protein